MTSPAQLYQPWTRVVRIRVAALLLVLAGALSRLGAAAPLRLYVAPDGNDAWSGAAARPAVGAGTGPLATLDGARRRIRTLRRAGKLAPGPVHVLIEDGLYFLNAPVVFTPEDSGARAAPVVYEAAPGAHPLFSGGRRIVGWKPGPHGVWFAKIPDVAAGKWYFEQLWVNGRRAVRARSPNRFYYYTREKVEYALDPRTGKPARVASRAFRPRPADVEPLLHLSPKHIHDVTIVAYHSWETTRARLDFIDPKQNLVFVTHAIPWGFCHWGPRQRYHIENFRAALDQPGEWFLDRDGVLFYIPRPGEDMRTATVIAPAGPNQFLQIQGDARLGMFVEHLTFRGLRFMFGQYILPPQGHGDGQAEVSVPAAIMLDGARQVRFEDCAVRHVGIYGIWFRAGCRDCEVRRCWFDDLGAGGVKIGVGWGVSLKDTTVHTSHITVDDCIIHAGGRIHQGAIGVWIGHSGYNTVTHNDISDLFYTGISVGWVWGYRPSLATHNRIEYNHIHHIGQGVLSDMGGVYTLGPSPGTTVSNNRIHDVYSYDRYGRGGWGLYADEGSSDILFENNLVYNVKTGCVHQHYGKDNIFRNNILAFSMDGQVQRSRREKHISFYFRRNIVYWRKGPLYTGAGYRDDGVVFDHNLYWRTEERPLLFYGHTLAQWQAMGKERGSMVADPRFKDPGHYDFHLRPDSPAPKIGFKPFDFTRAGLYGDSRWVRTPQHFRYAPLEFAPLPPLPPPLRLHEGFETTPVGARPAHVAVLQTENHGASIRVTDETAARGKHALKVVDVAGNAHDYDPHFAYAPNYDHGLAVCGFSMKLGKGARLYHEWRSWDIKPYRVGPTFRIAGNTLQITGRRPIPLPLGRWFHLTVSAPVGRDANGRWRLILDRPGKPRLVLDGLKNGNADFANLTWLGWASTATRAAVFYLDDISLDCRPLAPGRSPRKKP